MATTRTDRYWWHASAACKEIDPMIMFPTTKAGEATAKAVCFGCTVRTECLNDAITREAKQGVWGGTTPAERDELVENKKRVEAILIALLHNLDLGAAVEATNEDPTVVGRIASKVGYPFPDKMRSHLIALRDGFDNAADITSNLEPKKN